MWVARAQAMTTMTATINNNDKDAYADHLNSFTHLRALLVFHDRSILLPT
jgi:hypothetical protein